MQSEQIELPAILSELLAYLKRRLAGERLRSVEAELGRVRLTLAVLDVVGWLRRKALYPRTAPITIAPDNERSNDVLRVCGVINAEGPYLSWESGVVDFDQRVSAEVRDRILAYVKEHYRLKLMT